MKKKSETNRLDFFRSKIRRPIAFEKNSCYSPNLFFLHNSGEKEFQKLVRTFIL